MPCHSGQTSQLDKISVTKLRTENVAYLFEVLGDAAPDYLRRHYKGWDDNIVKVMRKLVDYKAVARD